MQNFMHHKYFPKERHLRSYRFPFVCFGCRKSFKYPASATGRACPQCQKPLEMLGRKFSAPRTRDLAQWKKVEYLVAHGFRFYSVGVLVSSGGFLFVKYPSTLAEAKRFVRDPKIRVWGQPSNTSLERTRGR
jgi:hypothetical protein